MFLHRQGLCLEILLQLFSVDQIHHKCKTIICCLVLSLSIHLISSALLAELFVVRQGRRRTHQRKLPSEFDVRGFRKNENKVIPLHRKQIVVQTNEKKTRKKTLLCIRSLQLDLKIPKNKLIIGNLIDAMVYTVDRFNGR